MNSLQEQNAAVALWVIENDSEIDEARTTLEERAVAMLATQQPIVAQDLRFLASIASIATELERIGDYASAIARRVYHDPDQFAQVEWSSDLERMAELARQMLHTSIETFIDEDAEKARTLGQTDDTVDALRDTLRAELIAIAQDDTHYLHAVIDVLYVVHALERTADRATNIAERVIYIVTNATEEINP
jgi:phosphate transport system protein